jgi:1,4-dihydroxy-2-naphthoyl-CoA hydrolase
LCTERSIESRFVDNAGQPRQAGPFAEYLGLQFEELTGTRVVAVWTAAERLHQPHGNVHGGVYAAVVETLASFGAATWYGEQGRCVGISNQTDFFRAVSSGRMTSVATPIHQGRSQQVWVVETHDGDGRLVARGQLRVQNLPGAMPASGGGVANDRQTPVP